jgi:hypothetical protein
MYDGTLTMNGGEISGNTSSYGGGGGVYGTLIMNDGKISGNIALDASFTNQCYGGGVCISDHGAFIKLGGTITGYTDDMLNDNVVKTYLGFVMNNRGHAVYVDSSPVKRRESTAGLEVNMDSSVSGAAGGGNKTEKKRKNEGRKEVVGSRLCE